VSYAIFCPHSPEIVKQFKIYVEATVKMAVRDGDNEGTTRTIRGVVPENATLDQLNHAALKYSYDKLEVPYPPNHDRQSARAKVKIWIGKSFPEEDLLDRSHLVQIPGSFETELQMRLASLSLLDLVR
jgi:hypothetical protein